MRKYFIFFLVLFSGCTQLSCMGCDDSNPCTFDSCVDGVCQHRPLSGPVDGCFGRGGCMEYACFSGECLPQRLQGCCGNGVCEEGENHPSCPRDCTPSCVDGVRNQGEDDVDCGGPCTPCESPELTYLTRVSSMRKEWEESSAEYTEAIRAYNSDQDTTALKAAALDTYGLSEQLRVRLAAADPPQSLGYLKRDFNDTLGTYLEAVHNMVLYANTGVDGYRLTANRLFADAGDMDRSFVVTYNSAVDRYNTIQYNCVNHVVDEGEESVDCGSICRRPCAISLNVTKQVVVRNEGGEASVTLNVSSPVIDYQPQQRLLSSSFDPEPDEVHTTVGGVFYIYSFPMPAYGVKEFSVTHEIELHRMPPPVKAEQDYFTSLYLLENDFSPTTDDICYRAGILKGNRTDTSTVVSRIQGWIRNNIEYEYNSQELGAEHCFINRRGACDEHADLFIAMARCAGIPARRVSGSLVNASDLRGHAWAEYYDGSWTYIDPSAKKPNQPHASDNKHITACVGETAYHCGLTYTYTHGKQKPEITVEEKIYLS